MVSQVAIILLKSSSSSYRRRRRVHVSNRGPGLRRPRGRRPSGADAAVGGASDVVRELKAHRERVGVGVARGVGDGQRDRDEACVGVEVAGEVGV